MKRKLVLCLLAVTITGSATAQEPPTPEELAGKIESIIESFTEAKNTLEILSRLRITGYVQAQYVDNQSTTDTFQVRRGRLNFSYQATPTSRFVIQPDLSSAGGVQLRDAYVELTEPWTPWHHTVTAGQFKVPFGFEIRQSSRDREMPERTRVITTLFPGERDRGAMLSGSGLNDKFNYRVAVLNGNGIPSSNDADEDKDIAGRIGVALGAVDFGVSGYTGKQLNNDKERLGVDVQWVTPVPGLGFRGEYIKGKQPFATGSRDVMGWFVYGMYNLGTRHQFVLRYDTYDPNTDASRDAVDTVGGSYIVHWDGNLKTMFAYERPKNEGTDPADNILTIRMQYAF
jgi:hypothetical protein